MTAPAGLEVVDLEALGLEDFDIACDFDGMFPGFYEWTHGPATWQMRLKCGECDNATINLVCETCKEACLQTPAGVLLLCNHVTSPYRRAISKLKRLK